MGLFAGELIYGGGLYEGQKRQVRRQTIKQNENLHLRNKENVSYYYTKIEINGFLLAGLSAGGGAYMKEAYMWSNTSVRKRWAYLGRPMLHLAPLSIFEYFS